MDLYKRFNPIIKDIESNPMGLADAPKLRNNPEFRQQIWKAHQVNKSLFCSLLEKWKLKEDVFTVCWARRIAAYKRPSLILQDVQRLLQIAKKVGPLQIILAGKAHPNDNLAFTYINEMLDKVDALEGVYDYLKILIMENYDIHMGKVLTSCVDMWLNNPVPPFEASGTSGMKAMLNGVVQMSTLDGWVVEAEDMGIGKIFGQRYVEGKFDSEFGHYLKEDVEELYQSLEEMAAMYYTASRGGNSSFASPWIDKMINCVAAGAHFNTYRMLDEYKHLIWGIREEKVSAVKV
jgi:starch phosphorylase